MRKKLFLSYVSLIVICLLGGYFAIYNMGYGSIRKHQNELSWIAYQELGNQMIKALIFLAVISVILSILFLVIFTKNVIKPMEQVMEMAERIAKGEYGLVVNRGKQGELEHLVEAFNQMSTNLQNTMEDLNSRNMELENFEAMRKQFVSNVTHELKTPLTSIRGFVDTLKNGALEDKEYAEHFLDIIDIEAERLGKLIQDILSLSEMESGERPPEEQIPCNIKSIWEEVYVLLKGKCKERVVLFGEFLGEVPDFYANPYRLKEILLNLVDNAVTYTEKGYVQVTFRKKEETLIISVKDTGIGIEKEHLPRLFERFYRVDKGRSRKQGGTGLGLSIVKHIVELYEGTIEVSSVPAHGTCFVVKLPYKVNEHEKYIK